MPLRSKTVQFNFHRSNGTSDFTTLLRLDANFVMPPRVHRSTNPRFWGPKSANLSPEVLRLKPSNPLESHSHYAPSTISTRVTTCLQPPDYQVLALLLDLVNRCLDLVNTIPMYTCLSISSTTHGHSSGPPSLVPSLHAHPSPLVVHRHGLISPSSLPPTILVLHTCT